VTQQFECNKAVKSLCFFNQKGQLIVALQTAQAIILETKKLKQVDAISLGTKKKKKPVSPDIIRISSDDKWMLEAYGSVVKLRALSEASKDQVVAKFEGHSQQISDLAFHSDSIHFVSTAGNQCNVWNPVPTVKKYAETGEMQVVSQPAFVLASHSSDPLFACSLCHF